MTHHTLVDSFLFSEPFELEVLLAKLNVESEIIDHWIAVENKYTTKGDPKGTHLKRLANSDERFRPFLDRLSILTLDRPFALDFKPTRRDRLARLLHGLMRSDGRKHYRELPFFYAERAQRDAATERIIEVSEGKGAVMISDVDEMLDGSDISRRQALERALDSDAIIIHLPRRQFVFDFDNVSMARFRHVPMVAISALRAGPLKLGELRSKHYGIPASPEPLVFEYSYCYDQEAIHRKLMSFAHLHPGDEVINRALRCNHALTSLPPHLMRNDMWFETVSADEARHPLYIRDNLARLKTNSVNPSYREARRREYPSLFSSPGKQYP